MNIFIIIVALIIYYILSSSVIGITYFSLFRRNKIKFSFITILILFLIFAISDLSYIPLFNIMDAKIEIGNEEIANLYKVKGKIALADLYKPDWYDLIFWSIQTSMAYFVGDKINRKYFNKK